MPPLHALDVRPFVMLPTAAKNIKHRLARCPSRPFFSSRRPVGTVAISLAVNGVYTRFFRFPVQPPGPTGRKRNSRWAVGARIGRCRGLVVSRVYFRTSNPVSTVPRMFFPAEMLVSEKSEFSGRSQKFENTQNRSTACFDGYHRDVLDTVNR